MIFVTVGTHEQPFNRIVKYMDKWADNHDEEVVIQTGFSTYKPQKAKYQSLFSFDEMIENVEKARIIITHGGPSSFIMPLQIGKTPIVVPRRKEFNEHVNNHQVSFCNQVAKRQGNIIVVDNISKLQGVLEKYDEIVNSMSYSSISNNKEFCKEFEMRVNLLMNNKRR